MASHPAHDQTAPAPNLLTSLINSMADGVIAVDSKGIINVYNGAALNILDLNSSIQGICLDKVVHLIDGHDQPVDLVEYIRSIKLPTVSETFRLRYSDSSISNLYISVSPVHASSGTSDSGYVLVLRDITREKSLEEERNEFISVVSHELRTPVTIAEGNIGNAEYVLDKTGDLSTIKQALHDAHEQTLFLAAMINDLATLSRAERGKLTVEVEAINAHELVNDLITGYESEAHAKHLILKAELDPKLELLQSSGLYVREILQNFITNALKYTEKGSITLSAAPRDHGVEFKVSDTGIGISKVDQEKVFDKFFRSEDFRTRQTNGTGLGLYVTMKLAHLLHADISLASILNQGSTFTIYIPNLSSASSS